MLVRITGAAKDYAWGSKDLIPDYFGQEKSSTPIAEVWFGTHPLGPSRLVGSETSLAEKTGSSLGFLLKLLSAKTPLSIQVHPTMAQARAGFDSENSAAIALDDPKRNYKDPLHKPEILIALTSFRALCGFRPRAEITQIFEEFGKTDQRFLSLKNLLENSSSLEQIFQELIKAKELAKDFSAIEFSGLSASSQKARDLAVELLGHYPNDTGALVALLLNEVELEVGEAIFLPAGNLHAYLCGLGVEVMAASDNVIRGGLTPKHIDVAELMKIVDFSELPSPKVSVVKLANGLFEYPVSVSDFRVYRAELSGASYLADLDISGPMLVLCTQGEVAVGTSLEEREVLRASEVVYLRGAKKLSLGGSGTAFLVSGN